MGQAEIHKKIMSLKFQDCHAKIRQVDSQPTVGNAVVVQVTGELSNNRQPMRRFMQTFILAPQSPKKYYVHNDIFRYQDEVFHDLDGGVDGASAHQVTAQQDVQQDMQQEAEVEEELPEEAVAPAQQEPVYFDAPQQQPAMSNGTGQMEEPADSPDELSAAPVEEVVEEQAPAYEPAVEKEEEPVEPARPAPAAVPQQPQEPPKPVSWAAMASQRPAQQAVSMPAPQQPPVRPVAAAPVKPAVDASQPKPGDAAKPQGQRPPRQPRGERRENSRSGADGNQENNMAGEPRGNQQQRMAGPPPAKFSDAHQLFVGNLPHNIEEVELKDFFEKDFGKVMEVRINRKSSNNRDVPNFGFVVFAAPETVQKVLQMKPILLREDIRLNVEEKKQRGEQGGRPGSGNRMGGRGGGQGMMGGRGGQGGMGPRGGGRGGAGGPPRGAQGAGGRGGFGGGRR